MRVLPLRIAHAAGTPYVVLLVATVGARLPAQSAPTQDARWSVFGSVAVRYGTTLVHDSIVSPLDVSQRLGIALGAGIATPVQRRWSGEAAVDVTFTGMTREEAGGSTDLGALRTLTVTAAARRQLAATIAARAGVGALYYLPAEDAGIFRSGTGGVTPLGLVGVTWAPPWGSRYGFVLDVRYDIHRFITPALRATGFTEGRLVHRVAVGARAGSRAGR